mgnify:CR=1 FL=1
MIIPYAYFTKQLDSHIKSDDAFCYELLKTVIKNPERYTGLFRLSNAKTKLIQNVTQSREIKFGNFMEEMITDYIAAMGYKNMEKHIGCGDDGKPLNADQVFLNPWDKSQLCLIEQKMRDDHDSTKKRGQYANFQKKYTLLKSQHPDSQVFAIMWFIDDSLKRNRFYYQEQAAQNSQPGIYVHVLYGKELFHEFFRRPDVWEELCGHLLRNKMERSSEILSVPDFDTSSEMLTALRTLKGRSHAYIKDCSLLRLPMNSFAGSCSLLSRISGRFNL